MKKLYFFIITLLVALAIVYFYGCYRSNKEKKQLVTYATNAPDEIDRWKDKKGNEHAEQEIESVPIDIYNKTRDSFISALRKEVKAKNLLQAAIVKLKAKDSLFAPFAITEEDSTDAPGETLASNDNKRFEYVDDCIYANGVSTDSGVHLTYNFNPGLTIISKWKDPGVFKPKILVTDVITDRCWQVDTLRSVVPQKPPKKFIETRGFAWGLGFVLGALAFAAAR